jgi:hypothetical protein
MNIRVNLNDIKLIIVKFNIILIQQDTSYLAKRFSGLTIALNSKLLLL